MKTLILYCVNTALLLIPIVKQCLIIIRAPENDKNLAIKTLVFLFSLFLLAAMWFSYFNMKGASGLFFFITVLIIIWTYKDKKFKK